MVLAVFLASTLTRYTSGRSSRRMVDSSIMRSALTGLTVRTGMGGGAPQRTPLWRRAPYRQGTSKVGSSEIFNRAAAVGGSGPHHRGRKLMAVGYERDCDRRAGARCPRDGGLTPRVPVLAATAPRWHLCRALSRWLQPHNLLLMALTLAVCLVVDNAIVMADPQQRAAAVILQRPDVAMAGIAIGGIANSGINTGRLFISLKPSNEHVATDG
jgi:hypothetical protein